MKWVIVGIFTFFVLSGVSAQEIETYSFEKLEGKLETASQNQYLVINFWATWCKPCIKELPYFETLQDQLKTDKFDVLLVSLDMEKEKAVQYAKKHDLRSEVLYLDEVDFNTWIDQISPEWSGAIPATLLISPSGKRAFYEGSFEQKELNNTVKRFMQNN